MGIIDPRLKRLNDELVELRKKEKRIREDYEIRLQSIAKARKKLTEKVYVIKKEIYQLRGQNE